MKCLMVVFTLFLAVITLKGESGGKEVSLPTGSIECGADGSPLLYVMQNGLGFGTVQEEAKALSDLGYGGVSQVKGTAEKISELVAAYRKEGLRVRSVYLDAGDEAKHEGVLKSLSGSGAMVELTVRKMNSDTVDKVRKTCATAEDLGIKVALYPHHGFAVATMPQAMDLIKKVDHPNLGVMFNLCHFLRGENEADLEKVINGAGDRLFAVSVSGGDLDGKDWPALIKPLDQGSFPQSRLLDALEEARFQGPVSLQCYGVPGDKKTNIERSIVAWKKETE